LEIKQLALEGKFDYLLIESTGVSEPLPVAETFTFGELEEHNHDDHDHDDQGNCETGQDEEEEVEEEENAMKVLSDIATLDCMVTVMDAKQFFEYLQDGSDVFERWGEEEQMAEEDIGTSVCSLLIEQLEFANVILLNKTDLVTKEEMDRVCAVVRKLNPAAKILQTKYSKVEPSEVLNTGMFDFEQAHFHAGWLKEIRGEHVPETAEYGITSFIYRSRRPFNSARFEEFLDGDVLKEGGVIRAKGSLWLDCADKWITVWDKAGASIEISAESKWFIEMQQEDPEVWESMEEGFKQAVMKDFQGDTGDKRQEMVFIGQDMNENQIRALVDSCLLTDDELAGDWQNAEDPFGLELDVDVGDASEEEIN